MGWVWIIIKVLSRGFNDSHKIYRVMDPVLVTLDVLNPTQ